MEVSARPGPRSDQGRRVAGPQTVAPREVAHVASIDHLTGSATRIALDVEAAVLGRGARADRALAGMLRGRRDLALPDHRFVSRATFALFRWRGWVGQLGLERPEDRLLVSWLLDATTVHPVCRAWAKAAGRDPASLIPLGDAPGWTARAEGLKRLVGDRAINADPWRLFPDWLRENLPLPPGGASVKQKYLELLDVLQARPSLWVRAQGAEPQAVWAALGEEGLKPWIHRHVRHAAKLDVEADVHHLEAFQRGELEIQDLASQAVAIACDPDPGERWWDACAGAGGKAIHLAGLMKGKGLVVASDVNERALKETVRRSRRSPFRNLTTKPWDGKHVVGKSGTYDGVLVDAPCSGIGTWRRNPDARWTLDRRAIPRLAETQSQILQVASGGVRPGGTLVYAVCTLTPAETLGVVRPFLESHPEFQLDPFPDPIRADATPNDGTLQIWPQDADTMFIARLVRSKKVEPKAAGPAA